MPPAPTSADQVNILLVDDQPANLLALEAMLQGLGQNLVKAESGREALKWLLTHDFAVILLDVKMPDMDGFETAALIRERDKSRDTPIIFLTAADKTHTEAVRGYAVGAVDYLVKPVVPEFVRSKVSVFVELAKKTELLRRQADRLREGEQAARDLAETRAELVRELEHKNQELESFSYAVSHDLRAPLRRIEAFSRAVMESQESRLDEAGQRFFDRIQEASRQMSQLIDDVLHLSKVSRAELRQQDVDLSGLVAAILDRIRESEPDRSVEVRIRPGVSVVGDGHLLRIALTNLLENAWKFTARAAGGPHRVRPDLRRRRAHVFRARQRRGLRHDLRRPPLRPLPAPAPGERVSRVRESGWPRSAASSIAWAGGCGPREWWGRARRSTSRWAGRADDGSRLVNGLPEDVHRFLHQHIDSVEQLEVLLLLWRSPERGWTSDEVATTIYSHPTSVVRRLALLLGQGLLREREPGCYQYAPRTAELHAAVSHLDRDLPRAPGRGDHAHRFQADPERPRLFGRLSHPQEEGGGLRWRPPSTCSVR